MIASCWLPLVDAACCALTALLTPALASASALAFVPNLVLALVLALVVSSPNTDGVLLVSLAVRFD